MTRMGKVKLPCMEHLKEEHPEEDAGNATKKHNFELTVNGR